MLLAVYSDDGSGKPQYLRAVSEETAVNSTAGWQTIELIQPILAKKGTKIWLSWVFESNPGVRYIAGTPGRASSGQAWAYGMPATFGSSTVDSYKYSICANYTVEHEQSQITLIGNPYMYTARAYDIETGLYYYRARYYNPRIGRFLQVDPARDGINWYAYCGNNSINCIDPSGESLYIPRIVWRYVPVPRLPSLPSLSPSIDTIEKFLNLYQHTYNILGMQTCQKSGIWIYNYPDSSGQSWTGPWFDWRFFFGWYQRGPIDPENHNRRVPVDLGLVGLLDKFKNTPAIQSNVLSFIARITATTQRYADECLRNGITYSVIPERKDKFKYDFASGISLWTKILLGDPLVILGEGRVDVNWSGGVYIPYGSNKLHWSMTIHFEIVDAFKDPADLNNDGTPGDWPSCLPYDIKGGWDVYLEGDAH